MRILILITLMVVNIPLYAKSDTSITTKSYPVIIDEDTQAVLSQLQNNSSSNGISKKPLGQIMSWVALQLLNQPYVGSLLDLQQPEYLYISLTKTDCMLFIEEVLAVSILIKENRLTMPNFIAEIKQLRYHDNDDKIAYCTRNHYFKDWALTNIQKHLVVDEAYKLTHIVYPYKADIISSKLKNDPKSTHYADLQGILEREQYINAVTHHLGFIPLKLLPQYLNKIQNGDIIGIVRFPTTGDAIHHVGIASITKNVVGMIHASSVSSLRKVVIAPSLVDYLAQFKDSQGIILLRPN